MGMGIKRQDTDLHALLIYLDEQWIMTNKVCEINSLLNELEQILEISGIIYAQEKVS